ncbi:MAG: hypothetical protein PHU25_09385 [Deltaproteobacteria bacterium]|nr:hypothetical protein [Deltaproteobacteria bacterium]
MRIGLPILALLLGIGPAACRSTDDDSMKFPDCEVGGDSDGDADSDSDADADGDGDTEGLPPECVCGPLRTVWGTSVDDVWSGGPNGFLTHWDGEGWTDTQLDRPETIYGVWGFAPDSIFAVGGLENGCSDSPRASVFRFDGGGWHSDFSTTDGGGPLRAAWGSSVGSLLAVGDGTMLRYDGWTWSGSDSFIGENLTGILGFSAFDVFVVGWHVSLVIDAEGCAVIFHYGEAGWEEQYHEPGGHLLSAVWVASPTAAFAVGRRGMIVGYDGEAWSEMDSGVANDLNAVWGVAADDVFAVGNGSAILHYNGVAWTSMHLDMNLDLYGIWGFSASEIFAVGGADYGLADPCSAVVLRYDGAGWNVVHEADLR